MAKQFFRAAVRQRLILESPFADMKKTGDFENRDREEYVTRSMYEKVLKACPSSQWKAIVALARIGGLRPSEILILRWGDILWDVDRILVHSPKTEHHEGKDKRIIPLYPELRSHLQALHDELPESASTG